MRILLSSSLFHYNPKVDEDKYYHSTGLTVKVFYQALKAFGEVDICNDKDTPTGLEYDLLVSWPRNYNWLVNHNKFRKSVCFLNCAEPIYLKTTLLREAGRLGCKLSDSFYFNGYQTAPLFFVLGRQFNRDCYAAAGVPVERMVDAWYQTNAIPFKARDRNKRPIFLHMATTLGLRKGFWWALQDFKRAGMDAELWCVGRVQKEKFWIDLAMEASKDPRIKIIGWVDFEGQQQRDILHKADFMVFPTFGEGQAGTVTEAMAAGCVPITNRESGVPYFPLGEYHRGDPAIYQKACEIDNLTFHQLQYQGLKELEQNYNNEKFIQTVKDTLSIYINE